MKHTLTTKSSGCITHTMPPLEVFPVSTSSTPSTIKAFTTVSASEFKTHIKRQHRFFIKKFLGFIRNKVYPFFILGLYLLVAFVVSFIFTGMVLTILGVI